MIAMGLLVGIGAVLGAIGVWLLTLPYYDITINSYTVALLFLSFALFAGIIVYNKTRVSVGIVKMQIGGGQKHE